MADQGKWIVPYDNLVTPGSQVELTQLQTVDTSIGALGVGNRKVNVHGVRVELAVTDDADPTAGQYHEAFGYWALVLRSDLSTSIPTLTTGALQTQVANQKFWAIGSWVAQPGAPFYMNALIKTSRNIPRNADLTIVFSNSAVSDNQVRSRTLFQAFLTSM